MCCLTLPPPYSSVFPTVGAASRCCVAVWWVNTTVKIPVACLAPPCVTVDVSRNRYADGDGVPLIVTEGTFSYPSVAAVTYAGDGGEEEMHLFFTLAWFDLGSWAWAHYIAEWGTKGVFTVRSTAFAHGERRRPLNDTSTRSPFPSYADADEVPFKSII